MKSEEIIEAFRALSAEERATVRAAIAVAEDEPGASCCSETEMGDLKEMMARMQSSKDMASMCRQMMRMCQEEMAGKSCA